MRNRSRGPAILVALLLVLAPVAAWAMDLDSAKSAGQVGEQVDGYVGCVKADAPADVKQLVARINQGRKKTYAEIAAKNGVSVEAVAAEAGAKLVLRAPSGQWVKDSTGRWRQK